MIDDARNQEIKTSLHSRECLLNSLSFFTACKNINEVRIYDVENLWRKRGGKET